MLAGSELQICGMQWKRVKNWCVKYKMLYRYNQTSNCWKMTDFTTDFTIHPSMQLFIHVWQTALHHIANKNHKHSLPAEAFSHSTVLSENEFIHSLNICTNCWVSENWIKESKITAFWIWKCYQFKVQAYWWISF